MASNTIPFPPRPASQTEANRSSFGSWRRRVPRQPVGLKVFDFPSALPKVPARAGARRPYIVDLENPIGETSRFSRHDSRAQAGRIARQMEREIAAKSANAPGPSAPPDVTTLPVAYPPQFPWSRWAAFRLLLSLLSKRHTA